ncbi:hypothetical protein FQA39_LY18048 [Lamprigera yunnana]|nr:hypothetical protein FQA39_LY18048 [Lamprigera yunnana]
MKIYNTKFLPLGIFIIITLSYVICETPAGNSTVSPKGTSATTVGLVAEGGLNKNIIPPVRLNGREGYTPAPTNATTKNVITPVIEPANIYNATESEKNETINKDHKSVPRKGAPIVEKNNTTTIPKKPTITEPGNKEPFAPSHFVTGNSNSSSVYVPKVPNIDIYSNNQDNTQNNFDFHYIQTRR